MENTAFVSTRSNCTKKMNDSSIEIIPCYNGNELDLSHELVNNALSAISYKKPPSDMKKSLQQFTETPYMKPNLFSRNTFWNLHRPELLKLNWRTEMSETKISEYLYGHAVNHGEYCKTIHEHDIRDKSSDINVIYTSDANEDEEDHLSTQLRRRTIQLSDTDLRPENVIHKCHAEFCLTIGYPSLSVLKDHESPYPHEYKEHCNNERSEVAAGIEDSNETKSNIPEKEGSTINNREEQNIDSGSADNNTNIPSSAATLTRVLVTKQTVEANIAAETCNDKSLDSCTAVETSNSSLMSEIIQNSTNIDLHSNEDGKSSELNVILNHRDDYRKSEQLPFNIDLLEHSESYMVKKVMLHREQMLERPNQPD